MNNVLIASISFAYSQLILSAWLLLCKQVWLVQERIFALLLLAVAAFLSIPLVEGNVFRHIVISAMVAVPGMFWLFSASLFDDHFRLQRWHVGIVGYTVLFPILAKILHQFEIYSVDFLLISMPQGVEFVLLALTLYVVARYWNSDLIESRRNLRLWFCGLNGLSLFILVLFREVLFADADWLLSLQYILTGVMLLVTNAMLLNYQSDIWMSSVSSNKESTLSFESPAVVVTTKKGVQNNETEGVAVDVELVAKIDHLMNQEKAYKQMGLTIGLLAQQLNIPEYRLRQLINTGLGYRNFNDFLNQYRIKDASEQLASVDNKNTQVLAIALDVGFRSLSSFNKAFKEHFQLTPSAFRRQQLSLKRSDTNNKS